MAGLLRDVRKKPDKYAYLDEKAGPVPGEGDIEALLAGLRANQPLAAN